MWTDVHWEELNINYIRLRPTISSLSRNIQPRRQRQLHIRFFAGVPQSEGCRRKLIQEIAIDPRTKNHRELKALQAAFDLIQFLKGYQ